jgi:UDP-N-acetylmuramoylalanine--D-glutamate ligase
MRELRTAWIIGLGRSGVAAARCLLAEGCAVTALDAGDSAELRAEAEGLEKLGAEVRLKAGGIPDGTADVCVVSPGVPVNSPWVVEARARGVAVAPEIDIGAERCRCPVVGVTGSNGKSTMVTLCRDVLAAAGLRAECAGNIGTPLTEAAARSVGLDFLVVEVSSFQLETSSVFAPRIGVLMNLLPNHLDRHADMEEYGAAKARMFAGMTRSDTGIVPAELGEWARARTRGNNGWLTFGLSDNADFFYADHAVRSASGSVGPVPLGGTIFDNRLLGLTAAAALCMCAALSLDGGRLADAARAFRPLPHRLQTVAEKNGVRYVDDSKGTNLSATAAALDAVGPRVRLIAGGLLKEHDLRRIKDSLAKNATKVYLLGKSEDAMAEAWRGCVPCAKCGDLATAMARASEEALPGEVVLLSPGCASFDQFSGYAERGRLFSEMALGGPRAGTGVQISREG